MQNDLVHTQKYEISNKIVRCVDFSQPNNMHTSQHQYIHDRKPSLKTGLQLPETPRAGRKQCSILATELFHANYQTVYSTLTKGMIFRLTDNTRLVQITQD